ncbi:MAG: DUF4153 domain-containing protein [Actinomycetes bacterium]
MRGPLDRIGAIKLKLGALLGGGVLVTVVTVLAGSRVGLPTGLVAVAALALGLVAVDVLADGLTAPLRQMARQADRLASGQPVERVDDGALDEVGALARAFNRMADEVAHTDRVRRELVANVSHELRTPLAALTAVVENLVDGVEPADPARLAALEAQTARLTRLVGELLDLSQLDAGATRLDVAPTDLVALVAEAVDACSSAGRVTVDIAPEARTLEVDPARFGQVLVNLLDNALRHGPDGSDVAVRASRDGGVVRITVSDQGPGIAAADATRVFERFVRADAGRTTDSGGAGLGLSITRWIVELHGGSVRVDRPDEPGARLTVELPVAPVPPTVAPAGPAPSSAGLPRTGTSGAGDLGLLPTPIAGLGRRGLTAALVAAVPAALLPLAGPLGLAFAVVLVIGGAASLAALDRPPDAFGLGCGLLALLVATQWALTDAIWVLVPATLGALLLAGIGLWAPRTFGELGRALLVGPLLAAAAPVPLVRGLRSARGIALARVAVPAAATVAVVVVFGGLLGDADATFARLLDRVLPEVRVDGTLVLRGLLGTLAALLVATFALVQRAGDVVTSPWRRPVRPRSDWAVPLVVLVLLLWAFVAVQADALLGGDGRVLTTAGLTYAADARRGFGQLLVVTVLTLGVTGVVVRVAREEDRRLRDRLLAPLLGATAVVLVTSVTRLTSYVGAFGLSRLRIAAYAALLWVALVLVLVVVAGASRWVATALPRAVVLLTGALALGLVLVRPDAVIARVNVARVADAAGSGPVAPLDLDHLAGLSADATPVLVAQLPETDARRVLGIPAPDLSGANVACVRPQRPDLGSWNLARVRADTARAELACRLPGSPSRAP